MNEDAAHKVAHRIAGICARYPGCILVFERLRKIKAKGASKSRRMNRRVANQLRGKIRQYAGEKVYARSAVVTVEVNPHGTSQYCSRCGARGERFSFRGGQRMVEKWGKLFFCPVCHSQANADQNASVNVHHSFYHEMHWQWREKKRTDPAPSQLVGRWESPAMPGHSDKDWQARPASQDARNAVGLSLIPRGYVPAHMLELRVYLSQYLLGMW
jgi:hypothetical protein